VDAATPTPARGRARPVDARLDVTGGCDAVQVMGVELAGREERRVVRGVCEMYTDPEAIEADKKLMAERIPGEGKPCTAVPSDTARPPSTSAAPSDALTGCLYPLVCAGKGVCESPYR